MSPNIKKWLSTLVKKNDNIEVELIKAHSAQILGVMIQNSMNWGEHVT